MTGIRYRLDDMSLKTVLCLEDHPKINVTQPRSKAYIIRHATSLPSSLAFIMHSLSTLLSASTVSHRSRSLNTIPERSLPGLTQRQIRDAV